MTATINKFLTAIGALVAVVTIVGPTYGETSEGIGVFESQCDVGMSAKQGDVAYDSEKQEYQVTGSGKNMWFDKDEFHFVWKRIKGDFILRTQAGLIGKGVDKHRKLGWMVRATLNR